MRLNKYIAHSSGLSRRAADDLIFSGAVAVNGHGVKVGQDIDPNKDVITVRGQILKPRRQDLTIALHKPVGYVCSRSAQAEGVKTVYDLLPPELQELKTVGRLDKDSSGLILLTTDGDLAHHLTHPRFKKIKQYIVTLDHPLAPLHQQMISDFGINLNDGVSKLLLENISDDRKKFKVIMSEGRNRQIRRTFDAIGYKVIDLHRTHFGEYVLNDLPIGKWVEIN